MKPCLRHGEMPLPLVRKGCSRYPCVNRLFKLVKDRARNVLAEGGMTCVYTCSSTVQFVIGSSPVPQSFGNELPMSQSSESWSQCRRSVGAHCATTFQFVRKKVFTRVPRSTQSPRTLSFTLFFLLHSLVHSLPYCLCGGSAVDSYGLLIATQQRSSFRRCPRARNRVRERAQTNGDCRRGGCRSR